VLSIANPSGISILTFRLIDNVHPAPSICNDRDVFLKGKFFRRLQQNLKGRFLLVSNIEEQRQEFGKLVEAAVSVILHEAMMLKIQMQWPKPAA
jgi:hypothetical protein